MDIEATISRHDRFQFTMSEMLLTLIASFVGMAVLVPILFRDDRVFGCLLIQIGTFLGVMIAMKFTRLDSPQRTAWLSCGVVFGWLGAVMFQLLLPLRGEILGVLIAVPILFSPTLIGGVISYGRLRRFEKQPGMAIWDPLICAVLANFVLVFGLAIIIPSVLCTRCYGCGNEPAAAASCKAYAEAQEIYHRTDYTGNGVLKYAQHLHGTNSLLETKSGLGNLALIDKTFGNAEIGCSETTPKAGYVFKILKRQGRHAVGGRKTYIDNNGDMTKGYALVARPAEYETTGRDTFMISGTGTIFQQDLGPDTAAIVDRMSEFDPDSSWVPTQ